MSAPSRRSRSAKIKSPAIRSSSSQEKVKHESALLKRELRFQKALNQVITNDNVESLTEMVKLTQGVQ